MMFKNALVRIPCPDITKGLTSVNLGKPDYHKALEQHLKYIDTLKSCGLTVRILDADTRYPDSVFIEDIALCTSKAAVITNPGAPSRKGELEGIRQILEESFENIEEIIQPGTLEAGDVMMVNDHYYIGISNRTNIEGAKQLTNILRKYSMTGSMISLEKMLHLKSGASYLENNTILVCGEFKNKDEFAGFNKIHVGDVESYAANSLWINGKVLVPDGFPKTKKKIEEAGYETIVLDVSEFRKVDGGLSCLSLRF